MVVGVYFTNWSIYARQCVPSQLLLESITHIFYAFGKPDPATGQITLSDEWADIQKPMELGGSGCLGEFAILKQKFPHLRVLLSVGGYSYTGFMNESLRSPHKRREFVRSAARLVHKYNLDGIDLDWEYPSSYDDRSVYVDVVKQLRAILGSTKDLTIAAPAGQQNLQFMDLHAMDPYITFWNVMTYDFAGGWSPHTDHQAALYRSDQGISVAGVIDYFRQYIDPRKIVLGIPLYGRSFANTKGLGHSFQGSLPGRFEQGVHDAKELPLPGFSEKVDKKLGTTVCTDGRNLVSYDSKPTIIQKAKFARDLGGAMFWEASGDPSDSLVRVFAREYGR